MHRRAGIRLVPGPVRRLARHRVDRHVAGRIRPGVTSEPGRVRRTGVRAGLDYHRAAGVPPDHRPDDRLDDRADDPGDHRPDDRGGPVRRAGRVHRHGGRHRRRDGGPDESSWRAGCPVPLSDLRYLTLTYRGFDGTDHTGELVVAASVTDAVVATFRQLYADGYPIASMRLVDDFGGDDDASMAANNTSAFNCRPVTGGGGFSEHSYGTAIDVNPVQNPYVSGSSVLPPAGQAYADRPQSPGVIHDGDAVVTAFATHGFTWGGDWHSPIDYQHFSLSGR